MNSLEALTLCLGVAQDISLLGQQASAGLGGKTLRSLRSNSRTPSCVRDR